MPRAAWASEVEAAVAAVEGADFIAIGERHDNPDHHRLQAALVAALAPAGLAFEMIPQAMEEAVNRLRADGASRDELAKALEWDALGWPDFSLYASIMEAVPRAYVAGGGLSRDTIGAIYKRGAIGAGDALAERYGLDEPLADDLRAAMLDEQFAAHCEMMPRERLGGMVDIQRAWDAAYADALYRAQVRGGGRAFLICGNAHARLDRGAPAYLARAFPEAKIASIGMMETGDTAPDGQFTVTLSAPAPEREDACEQMRQAMEKNE
jgi:uncharacterized iron-regulated protein